MVFRYKNGAILLALMVISRTYFSHERSLLMLTPKYLADWPVAKVLSGPCNER